MKKICLCLFVFSFLIADDGSISFGKNVKDLVKIDIYEIEKSNISYFKNKNISLKQIDLSILKKITSNIDYQYIKVTPNYMKYRFDRTNEKWLSYEICFNNYEKYNYVVLRNRKFILVKNDSYFEILEFDGSEYCSEMLIYTNDFTSSIIKKDIGLNNYNMIIEEIKKKYRIK